MSSSKASGKGKGFLPKILPRIPFIGAKLAARVLKASEEEVFEEEYGPEALPASNAGQKAASGPSDALHAFKNAVGTLLGNRLALGLIFAFLLLLAAFVVVGLVVSSPPTATIGEGKAVSAGTDLLKRSILPAAIELAPRVELEREPGKVYTAEDVALFRTDPSSVDLEALHARNEAEIEALYGSVP